MPAQLSFKILLRPCETIPQKYVTNFREKAGRDGKRPVCISAQVLLWLTLLQTAYQSSPTFLRFHCVAWVPA